MVFEKTTKPFEMEGRNNFTRALDILATVVTNFQLLFEGGHEIFELGLMAQHVISRDADLPEVGHLTKDHTFSGKVGISCFINNCWTFSTELKNTRDKILGCRLGYKLSSLSGASEHDLIESHRGQFDCNLDSAKYWPVESWIKGL